MSLKTRVKRLEKEAKKEYPYFQFIFDRTDTEETTNKKCTEAIKKYCNENKLTVRQFNSKRIPKHIITSQKQLEAFRLGLELFVRVELMQDLTDKTRGGDANERLKGVCSKWLEIQCAQLRRKSEAAKAIENKRLCEENQKNKWELLDAKWEANHSGLKQNK
jgi:hypothetical protein